MASNARKLGPDCNPQTETLIEHQRCVDKWVAAQVLNTRTCDNTPQGYTHEACGPFCNRNE